MKKDFEKMSDKELQIELLKSNLRIEEKLPEANKPTLLMLGFISNDDFMTMFNIGEAKAAGLRESGELRYTTMGRTIYYKVSDIVELMNKNFNRK